MRFVPFFPSFLPVFASLEHAEATDLMRGMTEYCTQGKEPKFRTKCARIAFEGVRAALDGEIEKYERKCATNAQNGRKGGRPRKNAIPQDASSSTPAKSADSSAVRKPSSAAKTAPVQTSQQKPSGFSENPNNPVGFRGFSAGVARPYYNNNINNNNINKPSPSRGGYGGGLEGFQKCDFPTLEDVVQYIEGRGYSAVIRYVVEQYRLISGAGWRDADNRPIREWRRYFARIARNAIANGDRAAMEQTCFDFTKPAEDGAGEQSRRTPTSRGSRSTADGVYIQQGYEASIARTAETI